MGPPMRTALEAALWMVAGLGYGLLILGWGDLAAGLWR